ARRTDAGSAGMAHLYQRPIIPLPGDKDTTRRLCGVGFAAQRARLVILARHAARIAQVLRRADAASLVDLDRVPGGVFETQHPRAERGFRLALETPTADLLEHGVGFVGEIGEHHALGVANRPALAELDGKAVGP